VWRAIPAPPQRQLEMSMDNDDVIDVLNTLIETSKDGEYGFRTSAERVDSPELKRTLAARAQACTTGVTELQAVVAQLGGKPEESGTMAGAVHRGWVSLKDAVASRDDLSVLEECERGEDRALAKYRKALESPALTGATRELVMRQLEGVQRNHDDVKALRDQRRQAKNIAG
jgi:uncharacterized protein (TIGR02284 family)